MDQVQKVADAGEVPFRVLGLSGFLFYQGYPQTQTQQAHGERPFCLENSYQPHVPRPYEP